MKEENSILKKYDTQGTSFTFERFEPDLKQKEVRQACPQPITIEEQPQIISLQDYYSLQIKILDEQGRVGLSGLTYEVQRMLKKFKHDALLKDATVRFLESFEGKQFVIMLVVQVECYWMLQRLIVILSFTVPILIIHAVKWL